MLLQFAAGVDDCGFGCAVGVHLSSCWAVYRRLSPSLRRSGRGADTVCEAIPSPYLRLYGVLRQVRT
jgi:hypothetical protein